MPLSTSNGQTWDFAGAPAELNTAADAPDTPPAAEFPTTWRVFGPFDASTTETGLWSFHGTVATPRVTADIAALDSIPSSLTVGDTTIEGQDVALVDDTINFAEVFDGYEDGRQAYIMAEFELAEDVEVILGAGADYWMQWWLDGEPVMDTLATGNLPFPFSRTDTCVRLRPGPGRHVLAAMVVSSLWAWYVHAGFATEQEAALSATLLAPHWVVDRDGTAFMPPLPYWQPNQAIRTDVCLADTSVELEYQQLTDGVSIGAVIGARDPGHYYYCYVPRWGQLWRARGFWAAIGIADGSGFIRNLTMQLMPNVSTHEDQWHSIRAERRGSEIRMWVDGVQGPCVTDDTYSAGYAGIAGFSRYAVRGVHINGSEVDNADWPGGELLPPPRRYIEPDTTIGDFQGPGQLIRLGDEIITQMTIGRDGVSCHFFNDDNASNYLYSSGDGGRSWSRFAGPLAYSSMPGGGRMATAAGTIRVVTFDLARRSFVYYESADRGVSWGSETRCELPVGWGGDFLKEGTWTELFNLIKLRDGRWLAVLLHGYPTIYEAAKAAIPDLGSGTWGLNIAQPYATISDNEGSSWAEPVPMDNARFKLGDKPDSPCGGFSETAMAQLPNGKIVAVARPFRSPFMWQTDSVDDGETWRQACYAPFSGAGGPTMVATESGYLALIRRCHGIGMNISTDGGLNWDEGTMIDYTTSFNGSALEVEPDVVLVAYPDTMDEIRPGFAITQRLRITPDGPVPAW